MNKGDKLKRDLYVTSFLAIILIDIWLTATHYWYNNGQFNFLNFGETIISASILVVYIATTPVFVESVFNGKVPDAKDFERMMDKFYPKMLYSIAVLFIPITLFLA